MTSDMEGRIARVLVRSCHPEIPDAKVEELVNLGVGRATAQQIITELQAWEAARHPLHTVPGDELAQAQRVVARHECTAGHDFTIVVDGTGAPVRVVCARPCGAGPWPFLPSCPSTYAGMSCALPRGHESSHCEDRDRSIGSTVWTHH